MLLIGYFFKKYFKLCFVFCKGEQRLRHFIYQNFDVSVLLLAKADLPIETTI